ncbi:MAG: hypothetical protein QXL19_09290 [Ignisphaera sp.]
MSNEDIYLSSLINVIISRFNRIADDYENSAYELEKKIKDFCFLENDRDRFFYDKRDIISNVVLFKKKAFMYRYIAGILNNSMQILVRNKKKIDRKMLEKIVNEKMDIEEAVDYIIEVLKNVMNVNIDKNEYYEVREYEIRKLFGVLCKY